MQPYQQTVAPAKHCTDEPANCRTSEPANHLTATLALACIALVLATSLALITAAWFMISNLMMPDPFVPVSWVGVVDV